MTIIWFLSSNLNFMKGKLIMIYNENGMILNESKNSAANKLNKQLKLSKEKFDDAITAKNVTNKSKSIVKISSFILGFKGVTGINNAVTGITTPVIINKIIPKLEEYFDIEIPVKFGVNFNYIIKIISSFMIGVLMFILSNKMMQSHNEMVLSDAKVFISNLNKMKEGLKDKDEIENIDREIEKIQKLIDKYNEQT